MRDHSEHLLWEKLARDPFLLLGVLYFIRDNSEGGDSDILGKLHDCSGR